MRKVWCAVPKRIGTIGDPTYPTTRKSPVCRTIAALAPVARPGLVGLLRGCRVSLSTPPGEEVRVKITAIATEEYRWPRHIGVYGS